jgi:NADP-dependent 3-hydroxy acid dehydrogenase YdfG
VTDVTDYDNVKEVVHEIVHEFNGRLDIFVANVNKDCITDSSIR